MIAELEKLAREATPGPWAVDPTDEHHVIDVPEDEGSIVTTDEGRVGYCLMNPGNAAYIAAANPAAVLKLIAAVRAAKYVAFSNGFDAAYPDKLAALRQALAEVQQ
jgi:hypothetical protein